jgi:hypothetical protein
MNVLSFTLYYLKLRIGVVFGVYKTFYPLGVRWRWKFWHQQNADKQVPLRKHQMKSLRSDFRVLTRKLFS